MAFQEFTFVEPYSQLEFMVDVDVDNFKIIDCYTYIKDINELDKDDDDCDFTNYKWKVGKNPLFGHNKNVAKRVFLTCYCSVETEKEYELLFAVAKKNNFQTDGIDLS